MAGREESLRESFLGIDLGTSSLKAVLTDETGVALAEGEAPLAVSRPAPLWSEQEPEEWWRALEIALGAIRAAAPGAWQRLSGIGLSGQQHGATLLDGSGAVLRPCILWNDGRAAAECAELMANVPDFLARAGNLAMPGFTAPKLLWLRKHEPDVLARLAKVLLPKDYLRFRLSGEHVSDMSDASGTLWLDIANRRWDGTLLAATGVSEHHMPRLVEGSAVSAELSPALAASWGLAGRRIPIAGGAGDNAAAAIGIGAVRAGDGFISLGTSGVVFVATKRPVFRPERTLHGFCHALPGRWHGMAVILSAASALGWFAAIAGRSQDISGLLAEAEAFAAAPSARAHAPLFLPYLSGERTPHNDPSATGHFAGLRAEHGAAALCYAVIEGVSFALADGCDVLAEAGAAPARCMLVGGGARSPFWAGLLAQITGLALDVPAGAERGAAFGAARLGMLAAGAGEAAVLHKPVIARAFEPTGAPDGVLAARRARMRALYRPA